MPATDMEMIEGVQVVIHRPRRVVGGFGDIREVGVFTAVFARLALDRSDLMINARISWPASSHFNPASSAICSQGCFLQSLEWAITNSSRTALRPCFWTLASTSAAVRGFFKVRAKV